MLYNWFEQRLLTQFLHVHIMNQLDLSKARGPARGPHADPADCGTVPWIPQPAAVRGGESPLFFTARVKESKWVESCMIIPICSYIFMLGIV
jgi:hypothetical protein